MNEDDLSSDDGSGESSDGGGSFLSGVDVGGALNTVISYGLQKIGSQPVATQPPNPSPQTPAAVAQAQSAPTNQTIMIATALGVVVLLVAFLVKR